MDTTPQHHGHRQTDRQTDYIVSNRWKIIDTEQYRLTLKEHVSMYIVVLTIYHILLVPKNEALADLWN